jgi:sulfite reductase alpha subunit-like flavoprotein
MDIDTERDDIAAGPSLSEDDRKFLASRNKSAARSHLAHSPSATEQAKEDWARLDARFPAHIARQDKTWERNNRPVDSLDKDNILRDHPENYLLDKDGFGVRYLPPSDILPIPDTYAGTLVRNDRVTPTDHWQDVRHLAFSIVLDRKDFEAAIKAAGNMTLTIYPKNYPEDVQELISLMDWDEMADEPLQITVRPRGLHAKNGGVTTLRELLIHNLDFTAVPKRSFIKELVFFTDDEREKERLIELTMPGNEQEFYDYTCRPRRTILELLKDFTAVKIPVHMVLDLFPTIRGREFSVCNGGLGLKEVDGANSVQIEVLAALVEYKTIIRKPRQGLCSRYLKHLPVGTDVCFGLKTSSGPRLVPNHGGAKRPLIAIATGTGIAPIRSLIQERASYLDPGDTLLFFGCRNRTADFHFEREWREHPNVKVYPAFSRDNITPDPTTTTHADTKPSSTTAAAATNTDILTLLPEYDVGKNYVQHMIRKHAKEVGYLMRRNPIVCVCGNAGRMPLSVRSALLDALVISGVVGDTEAGETWFRNQDNLTFWQETW